MRLSDLITDTREAAAVLTANRWSDASIARLLNRQYLQLVRQQVHLDEAYHNYTFQLATSAARVKHTDVVTYRLPNWVMRVARVRKGNAAPTTTARQPEIPRATRRGEAGAWMFSANNELEFYGYSAGIDLELEVAKLPALLTKGTLPSQAGITTSQLLLDTDVSADAVNFPHEAVKDSYAGALFEITGIASARKGQFLRCTGSLHNQGGTTNQTLLTMEEAWTSAPVASDTYELHAEIATEHCRLLTLLATRSLLAQERNLNGMAAIAQELGEQMSMFIQHVSPRDNAGPRFVTDSETTSTQRPTIYELELL